MGVLAAERRECKDLRVFGSVLDKRRGRGNRSSTIDPKIVTYLDCIDCCKAGSFSGALAQGNTAGCIKYCGSMAWPKP